MSDPASLIPPGLVALATVLSYHREIFAAAVLIASCFFAGFGKDMAIAAALIFAPGCTCDSLPDLVFRARNRPALVKGLSANGPSVEVELKLERKELSGSTRRHLNGRNDGRDIELSRSSLGSGGRADAS
eukprot:CAMPEP_0195654238 /NCGR_PEP_ID=MMETSP0815-20121206/33812_1 /TAXON_ID=97485 /ORGANISM="Prymnesium parvum, Strain Texoma1" /LENGTH=129 /DNA_ID=CAMNT_0040798433 /DNA_START=296 /DNA_END=682 /DNA_ORIENTATION=-